MEHRLWPAPRLGMPPRRALLMFAALLTAVDYWVCCWSGERRPGRRPGACLRLTLCEETMGFAAQVNVSPFERDDLRYAHPTACQDLEEQAHLGMADAQEHVQLLASQRLDLFLVVHDASAVRQVNVSTTFERTTFSRTAVSRHALTARGFRVWLVQRAHAPAPVRSRTSLRIRRRDLATSRLVSTLVKVLECVRGELPPVVLSSGLSKASRPRPL